MDSDRVIGVQFVDIALRVGPGVAWTKIVELGGEFLGFRMRIRPQRAKTPEIRTRTLKVKSPETLSKGNNFDRFIIVNSIQFYPTSQSKT